MRAIEKGLANLKSKGSDGYWKERIAAELEYAIEISRYSSNQFDDLLLSTINFINSRFSEEGAISRSMVLQAEYMLLEISEAAKKYKMICAAHAHIDMNWMWRWDETVAVALDTFRTMLSLMEEYPGFCFSQSQASVYRIVEEYAPEMLKEIKERVSEGRWEVTASTWVEADKNMPNGESMARHILYTKKYLSELLDIRPDSLKLDFEPDTFGHSLNVPEILSNGGVEYYYHCRGYDGHNIYKWQSPSGSSVIVYREPVWYNAFISPSMVLGVPGFCSKYNMDTMLKVYGVGDHGGGPTRRDLERIIDMNTWPVFPQIRFGTFGEYFSLVDNIKDSLPIADKELNFIFTGCYTTQSRIKTANRTAEAALHESELFSAISALYTGSRYPVDEFAKAWKNVLFNQFHDIIPGSGTIDTREYAMGLFQRAMAAAGSSKQAALRSIAARIDTSGLSEADEDISNTISEGAGVGFGVKDFRITRCERGRGNTRIFHIFNPSLQERSGVAEIIVWDWQGDTKRIVFKDEQGNTVEHQLLDQGVNGYWGHNYIRLLAAVNVPACGYKTYTMSQNFNIEINRLQNNDPRVESINEFILENNLIKAVFDTQNAALVSLVDKATGEEFIDRNRPAGVFRYIEEDDSKEMTAWYVGRYMNIQNLTENVRVNKVQHEKNGLRQSLNFEIKFRSSTLKAEVSLDRDSSRLDYNVECDWLETGRKGKGIPQLAFYMPVGYECTSYKYDIPMGVIVREGMDIDVPANSWVHGMRAEETKRSVILITNSKYGFRSIDNSMSITLVRSAYDPDPYSDYGIIKFTFAVSLAENKNNKQLIEAAHNYNHPFDVLSDIPHKGYLPLNNSFLKLEGGTVAVSGVKMPETKSASKLLVVRLYETDGTNTKTEVSFLNKVKNAYFVDLSESKLDTGIEINIEDNKVAFTVQAYSVVNICVEFD